MPFQIVHNDITKMEVDAIVNAANSKLLQGGGVCGAIFKAAGAKELQEECNKFGGCPTGEAVITKGYKLPAKHIIHTVGPVWQGGHKNEEEFLKNAYANSLKAALNAGCESIAFPLISAGIYGYPKGKALKVAIGAFSDFLLENDMDIYLVVFNREAVEISEKLFKDVTHYIDEYYEPEIDYSRIRRLERGIDIAEMDRLIASRYNRVSDKKASFLDDDFMEVSMCAPSKSAPARSLEDLMKNIDETFSAMLIRLIDERNLKDSQVYKKANVDRKLFSKIKNNPNYSPKKATVIAFAIALELSMDETCDLLNKAGFALSKSSKFDIIVSYFIEKEEYDIFEINKALFCFGQDTLGSIA